VVGVEEFHQAWKQGVIEEVGFTYSGYVIGSYLDAQDVLNSPGLFDEQSVEAKTLCKIFTAAFPFHKQVVFPEFDQDKLLDFCRQEYGDDGPGLAEAINAAHEFYKDGLRRITPENLVVFTIR
jgi:hypothetical protein